MYTRPAGLSPSGPGPATPVVAKPMTQSPSSVCRYSCAVPAAICRATSGWTAPSGQQVGIHAENLRFGANVVGHRRAEEHFRCAWYAYEGVGE